MRNISPGPRQLSVFLCHSKGDKEVVSDLYRKLRSDGFNPWFDEESLLPGQHWRDEIRKAVKSSDVVIVCLSESSINRKGFVQAEIKYALDAADEQPQGSIYIIPAKLEKCTIPDRLSDFQWVELFAEKGYERLITSLREKAVKLGLTFDAPLKADKNPIAASIVLYGGLFLTEAHKSSVPTFWDVGFFRDAWDSLKIRIDGYEVDLAGHLGLPASRSTIDVIHTRSNGVNDSVLEASNSMGTSLLRLKALYGAEVAVDQAKFDFVLRFHSGRFTPTMIQRSFFRQHDPTGRMAIPVRKDMGAVAHAVSVRYELAPGDVLKLANDSGLLWSSQEHDGRKSHLEIEIGAGDSTGVYCHVLEPGRPFYWIPERGNPPSQP